MKARTRSAFALLALLGIALLLLLLPRTEPDSRAGARPAGGKPTANLEHDRGDPNEGAVGLDAPAPRVEARELVPAPSSAQAPKTGTVAVRVAFAHGQAAAGLAVRLQLGGEPEDRTLESSTDEAGRATFDVAAGSALRHASVAATATTTPQTKWLHKTMRAGAVVEVALQVSVGWPLAGRVIGPDGAPVPDAEVFGWCTDHGSGAPDRFARSGQDGGFRLEHLGPQFRVTASAPGMACSMGLRGELSDAFPAEGLTVELAPEKRMYGIVLAPDRNPVEGARVSVDRGNSTSEANRTRVPGILTFSAGSGSALSDGQGNFELTGLSHDKHYLLVERAPYLVNRAWRPTGERQEIVLDAGLSLRGRVLDSSGAPAAGARVRFWPFYSNLHTVEREIKCDEQGRFLLKGMGNTTLRAADSDDEPYGIAVRHAGHALQVVQPVEPTRQGGAFVEIRLSPERVLAGEVLDAAGAPLAGVDVWIEGDREMSTGSTYSRRSTWEYCNDIADAETDERGRFRFDGLYDGLFAVHAVFPDDTNLTATVETRSGDEGIKLVLDAEANARVVLVGQVRDGATGRPVTPFTLIPSIDGWGTPRKFESGDGRFKVSGLPPGPIQITLKADGYANRRIAPQDYAIGEHRLDVVLFPRRVLEVLVVDGQGKTCNGGSIAALDGAGEELWFERPDWTANWEHVREGRATLHGLPAEPVTLRITVPTPAGPRVQEVAVDLTQPPEETLEVVIRP
jgi:protocatechuate 3,4-dioxygenase beta subunit